jgi:dTDP-4-amino-4,6-dideoxygalactose transaminase
MATKAARKTRLDRVAMATLAKQVEELREAVRGRNDVAAVLAKNVEDAPTAPRATATPVAMKFRVFLEDGRTVDVNTQSSDRVLEQAIHQEMSRGFAAAQRGEGRAFLSGVQPWPSRPVRYERIK